MEFTTRFELQSQTTRLVKYTFNTLPDGSVTLYAALFQGTQARFIIKWIYKHNSAQSNITFAQIHKVSYSRFTRRY